MAKITLGKTREQESSYHLYKQPSERGEIIAVRRKVAMPSDVEHRSSKETKRQRERFGKASKRWASIPAPIRAAMASNCGIVNVQTPHGKSESKVLQGGQLFMAQDIHSQKYTAKPIELPSYCCIVLCDINHDPLPGELWLFHSGEPPDNQSPKTRLSPGNWLFYAYRKGREPYHPYGEAPGYYDTEDPAITYLKESELPAYHYHTLEKGTILFDYRGPVGELCPTGEDCFVGQRFVLSTSASVNALILKALVYAPGPGTFYLTIERTTPDGFPSGEVLTQGSHYRSLTPFELSWVTIPISPAWLPANELLAWVVWSKKATPLPDLRCFYIATLATRLPGYPNLAIQKGPFSGMQWTVFWPRDAFCCLLLGP